MARKFYNVRLGMQPIAWVNDDMHDIGDFISFDKIIQDINEAGFEGTELGRKFPRDPEVLKNQLKEQNLVLTSGWCDINFINPANAKVSFEKFKTHTDFLNQMGCRQVIVCEIGQSTNWDPIENRSALGVKKMSDEQWQMLADGLNACGEYANKLRMELVYHVHNGTVIETLEETLKLCDLTAKDSVYILMDTGHLHYNGVDPVKFIKAVGHRIRYIHLKDIRQDILNQVKKFDMDFNSSVRVGVFTMPGDGDIDFGRIFDALDEIGYQGWMVVEAEQNPLYADPLQYAKNCRKYLYEMLGQ